MTRCERELDAKPDYLSWSPGAHPERIISCQPSSGFHSALSSMCAPHNINNVTKTLKICMSSHLGSWANVLSSQMRKLRFTEVERWSKVHRSGTLSPQRAGVWRAQSWIAGTASITVGCSEHPRPGHPSASVLGSFTQPSDLRPFPFPCGQQRLLPWLTACWRRFHLLSSAPELASRPQFLHLQSRGETELLRE